MLHVAGLTVSYGPIQALNDVHVDVGEGELVAILGSNGAGKSTLLRTISGLVPPTAGVIQLQGQDLIGIAADRIARLGVAHVPEGRRVFPGLTVEENLLLGAETKRRRELEGDFDGVFQLFPVLAERRKQLGWSLSGGQQQMLAVGRALMSRPELLVLDEPSLGLAPLLVKEVLQVVRTICDTGTATLLVEQNARAALRIADRAYILRTGEIVHAGEAAALQDDDRMRATYLGA